MTITESNRMLDVLLKLAPTLTWLNGVEPVHDSKIPEEHAEPMKQLENLGLAYRRNNHICAFQKQRFLKIIRKEFPLAAHEQKVLCLAAFGQILELQDNQAEESPVGSVSANKLVAIS